MKWSQSGRRKRGRPKANWAEGIRGLMGEKGLMEKDWNDRGQLEEGDNIIVRTQHFFNNSNTNEDIATKFEQEYVRCVRNEEECVCSVCL